MKCKTNYPYISDKRMYAAVMGACSWIRKDGYFNKAVKYYSEKYNVDPKELEKNIRARQSEGQKGKRRGSYKWFVVGAKTIVDGIPSESYELSIVKGISNESVEKRFDEIDMKRTRSEDTGSDFSPVFFHYILGSFGSESEAKEFMQRKRGS